MIARERGSPADSPSNDTHNDSDENGPVRVLVESRVERAWCRACGVRAQVKDRPVVELIDLAVFGRPARLVWRKHR